MSNPLRSKMDIDDKIGILANYRCENAERAELEQLAYESITEYYENDLEMLEIDWVAFLERRIKD